MQRDRSKKELKAIKRYYAHKAERAEQFPHFRHYMKSNHPALITGELTPDEYKYRKVTHSEREGRHLNEKIQPNPDPTDERPMYIVKRQRHDKKKYFGKILPWRLPKK